MPLGALLLFAASLALAPVTESDLFFRLAAGREILARHALPSHNLFSFTAPDFPDLDASWLFEVGAALLFRHGGFPVVVIAKTVVVLVTAAAAFALCRRRGAGPVSSALAVAAALLGHAGTVGRATSHLLVRRRDRPLARAGADRAWPGHRASGGRAARGRRALGEPARRRLRRAAAAGAVCARRRDRSPARAGGDRGARCRWRRRARCWRRRSAPGSFATSRCT